MSRKALVGGVIGLFSVLGGLYFYTSQGSVLGASTDKPLEVRWLLSHQPTEVFGRAAAIFKKTLEEETRGALTLRVITPEEVGVAAGDIPNADVLRHLAEGTADLATAYTVALGKNAPDLWAVNLPYLFADHAAVGAALDGQAGAILFNALPESDGVVGLAFTMSGGYRIIASKNTQITSAADLKGKRIVTSGGPVAQETLKALGAVPVATDLEAANPQIDASTIDGVEITYSRLGAVIGKTQYTAYINETNHSVFLTAVLAGRGFYDTLTPEQQAALKKAAIAAAQAERDDSKALGEQVKAQLAQQGSTITPLSSEAAAEFVKLTRPVYQKFLSNFTAETVEALGLGN